MMNWLEMEDKYLKASLQSIYPNAQTALTAACAERVYMVWEDHWVGDYSTSVKDAVAFGWEYATNPATSIDKRQDIIDDLLPIVEYLNEEGITVLASSVNVSLRVMESVSDDNSASALALKRALGSTLHVAKLAGKISKYGKDKAQQEELAWQAAALEVAKTWQEPCHRQMFDGLGPTPSQWWLAYQAGSKYY
jgi:hypothetical protein